MSPRKPQDLFALSYGDIVTKRVLFDLIQYSKIDKSEYWGGPEMVIGNTPQQGINWIGKAPHVIAVIIKTRPGSYEEDGWSDSGKSTYHYSFKARNDVISYTEKANAVLIQQPQHRYPILLFTESLGEWFFEGQFDVQEIQQKHVVLARKPTVTVGDDDEQNELFFSEGSRKYVTHLMAERSAQAIKAVKAALTWICEICREDFSKRYGVDYIEAHHKVPISTYQKKQKTTLSELALLCPNCHRAVHIYMKKFGLEYHEIRAKLEFKDGCDF
jgi:putative restriction endonuclease